MGKCSVAGKRVQVFSGQFRSSVECWGSVCVFGFEFGCLGLNLGVWV